MCNDCSRRRAEGGPWEYPKAAAQVTGLIGCRSLAEAEEVAHRFIDPLLTEQESLVR
jgi:hypothetical protein